MFSLVFLSDQFLYIICVSLILVIPPSSRISHATWELWSDVSSSYNGMEEVKGKMGHTSRVPGDKLFIPLVVAIFKDV